MKTLPDAAVAKLQGRAPVIAGAGRFVFPSATYRFWSGYGTIEIDGEPFKGIGARALIAPINSEIGGSADGVVITLSGLDEDVAASIEAEDYHQRPVTLWRLVFADDEHTLLGSRVFRRGKLDIVTERARVGGEAALDFAIEGPRRDMSRSGARIRSDTDQRVLGGAQDGAMRNVTHAGKKTLRWGGRDTPAQQNSQRPGGGGDYGGGGMTRGVLGLFAQ